MVGSGSHAIWLGSIAFDGARAFEGVNPDLDRHCQRLIKSTEVLGMEPTFSAEEIQELALDGIKKFYDMAVKDYQELFLYDDLWISYFLYYFRKSKIF